MAQMRKFQVRYAFLSTYKATVFVKRADNFSFLISRPIGEQDTNLSVRQCFAAFCILAEQDSHYAEDPEFNPHRVSGFLGASKYIC